MATTKFYSLQAFFPELEQPEATILIAELDSMEGVDIWTVAGVPDIAWTMLVGGLDETHFEAVWNALRGPLMDIGGEWSSEGWDEEEDPSEEVKMMLEALYYLLMGFFAPKKRAAYEIAVDNILRKAPGFIDKFSKGDPNESYPVWMRLLAIAQTDAEKARPLMDIWFYNALGTYYASMVTDYIRLHSREYVVYGHVGKIGEYAPLPDANVFCAAIEEPRTFGSVSPNELGFFKIPIRVLDGIEKDATLELQFTTTHPRLKEPQVDTLEFDPKNNMRKPVVILLDLSKEDAQSNSISSTGISLPADVINYISSHSITIDTLADIRVLGGLKNLPTDTINKSDPDLLKLDGLAALEVLSMDVEVIEELYDRGYSGLWHVTQQPRAQFVSTNTDILGDLGAAKLHYQAQAAQLYAVNALASAHTVSPDGSGTPTAEHPALPGTPCDCPDCSSALSPLAYWADLLQFTTTNLKLDDQGVLQPVNLEMLETGFHQPLRELRSHCAQLDQRFCQNRLATEILWRKLGSLDPAPDLVAFQAAVKEYLMQTYELLLNKLGTSYVELRQARALDPAEDADNIKRITDRLGIVRQYGTTDETLQRLLIDLSDTDNIVEGIEDESGAAKSLEGLFGLRDSKRPPLEETPESDVERWKKARLREIWLEQHRLKNRFWNTEDRQVVIDPDVVTADDLRTPEDGNMPFKLWVKRRNWLDALPLPFDYETVSVGLVDHRANGNVIVLYADDPDEPFEAEDLAPFTADSNITYTTGLGGAFTKEYTVASARLVAGNIEITVQESIEVDRGEGTISWGVAPNVGEHPNVVTRTFQAPNIAEIFTAMNAPEVFYTKEEDNVVNIAPAWPATAMADILSYEAAIRKGDEDAIDELWDTLKLQPDELLWLAAFLKDYEGYPMHVHAQNNYEKGTWFELRDILVNVFKRLVDAHWRAEENEQGIALDPRDFWAAAVPPRPGPWPLLGTGGTPLIDPELISVRDLPEITVRKAHPFTLPEVQNEEEEVIAPEMEDTDALEVYMARRDSIADARVALKEALMEDEGFMAMLNLAFDAPEGYTEWVDYLELANALTAADSREEATAFVVDSLRISVEEFLFMIELGKRRYAGQAVPQRDLDRLFGNLTGAYKRIVLYPAWEAQERSEDLMAEVDLDDENSVEIQQQWMLRKAALPRWRASTAQRTAWLNALAEHQERPIIDPELIGPGALKEPIEEDDAFDLWKARWERMHGDAADFPVGGGNGWLADVEAHTAFDLNNAGELEMLTKEFLGHVEDSLTALREQQEDGIDIRPRLAQLDLSPAAFNQLLTCHDILVASPGSLTAEEKTSIQRILAGVQAKRHRFADRLEEQDESITLSQDFFIIREQAIGSFPPQVEYPLVPWLAEERDLILWRRQLRGRMEQEKSAMDAWQQVLHEVDEAMMVHLRDALVRVCGDPTKSLVENARHLGDQLLVDLENNCCYGTNRIAMAVETIQQLLWKTRTGDILQHYPETRYVGGNFDEAWTWMGSYANWRAAMFVFLYPENVLHPSLRKEGTPAFRDVLDATRNNRRFDPHASCEVVHAHGEYMKDISSLELNHTIQADVYMGNVVCGQAGAAQRKLHFLFARARHSGKAYYATVDPNNPADVKQDRHWTPVPGVEPHSELTGCDFYWNEDQSVHHLYLFFLSPDQEERDRFFAMRMDAKNFAWEAEPLEFEMEVDDMRNDGNEDWAIDEEQFDPQIVSMAVLKNGSPWDPPVVAVSLRNLWDAPNSEEHCTFHHRLDPTGTKMASKEWWDRWHTNLPDGPVDTGFLILNFELFFNSLEGRILDFVKIDGPLGTWNDALYFFLLQYRNPQGEERSRILRMKPGANTTERYQPAFVPANFFNVSGVPSNNLFIRHIMIDRGRQWFVGLASVNYNANDHPTKVMVFEDSIFAHNHSTDTWVLPAFHLEDLLPAGGCTIAFTSANGIYAGGFIPLWYQRTQDGHIRLAEVIINEVEEPEEPEGSVPPTFIWGPDKLRVTPKIQPPAANVSGSTSNVTWIGSVLGFIHNEDNNPKLLECYWETFYFVPMQVALQLQTNGHYMAALDRFNGVYDRNLPMEDRKIFHGLRVEETLNFNATRLAEWYADPLNPHSIAAIRRHTYTRYTIMAIAQCLLDYADAEFTTDTSETVPRARELYEDALDLLKLLAPPHNCPIRLLILTVENSGLPAAWLGRFVEAVELLEPFTNSSEWPDIVTAIEAVLNSSVLVAMKFAAIATIVNDALGSQVVPTMQQVLEVSANNLNAATSASLASVEADAAITSLSNSAAHSFEQVMLAVTGLHTEELEGESIPWLASKDESPSYQTPFQPDMVTLGLNDQLILYLQNEPAGGFLINDPFPNIWLSGVPFSFCVVPNPIVRALVMKAEVELWKIHNCMNIAGMVRELDPFAAPTDSTSGIPVIGAGGGTLAVPNARSIPPSAYRYRVLVERARQLVSMAQQVEAAFLSTLEKLDAERYAQLRAEQDIATSKATIKLQDLKVNEANSGVTLAEMQKDRATLQFDHFDQLLERGNSALEIAAFTALSTSVALQYTASIVYASAAVEAGTKVMFDNVAEKAAKVIESLASASASTSNLFQVFATLERRKEEWTFQRTLANQDVAIGGQQIKLAKDRVRIVGQEREIAVLQNDHAKATLDFLKNKFTSAELYEWMSRVLEDAYAWFLQEATAMAILAERQLAFERQVDLPPFIRTDYWQVDPNQLGNSLTGEGNTDRRGLTGSTRLLKDLSELDQYAFHTNSPKLQLSKTISLNEVAPEELMALRDGGIANFRTTHELFDRDYPGHYLRLIKKVSVTVIALNSPTKGIRATLTNGGVSRVWTGGTLFQERVINRLPEQIALSGGVSDHGVFQLQGEGEFLNPFEGTGVDTQWEFRMEKAANPFDYNSIADVLITIEYEAMNSFLWRNTVVQRLNNEDATAGLSISMKHNLPDQWFDLHNPEQTDTPYEVSFRISERDVAPHMSDPYNIDRLLVYVLMKDGEAFNQLVRMKHSTPSAQGENSGSEEEASVVDGIARFTTGVVPNTGTGPLGEWTISFLPNSSGSPPNPFDDDLVEDILILFNYSGDGAKFSF